MHRNEWLHNSTIVPDGTGEQLNTTGLHDLVMDSGTYVNGQVQSAQLYSVCSVTDDFFTFYKSYKDESFPIFQSSPTLPTDINNFPSQFAHLSYFTRRSLSRKSNHKTISIASSTGMHNCLLTLLVRCSTSFRHTCRFTDTVILSISFNCTTVSG